MPPMSTLVQIQVLPHHLEDEDHILEKVFQKVDFSMNDVSQWSIRKRSIDARQRRVLYNLQIELWLNGDEKPVREPYKISDISNKPSVAIIGGWTCWIICRIASNRRWFKACYL
ncbi:NAD(FAD)-utilizing dehydrogenases [Nonlabens ulvanivorans]|uniref:NAD(FAD)-utilizing dehydrogenases n=1 Tax=Nonlabens ulvanivorans TaxID=906888 RepID=A0A090X3G6_NONUL|nr:NAD(FAD)-utilizing dehydrogenases [Nonlabens ulvanivorans]